MFWIDPSTMDFAFESILWFWVEMSSFIDPPTVKLSPEFILRFQVEMLRKINWSWPRLILWYQVEMLGKAEAGSISWF